MYRLYSEGFILLYVGLLNAMKRNIIQATLMLTRTINNNYNNKYFFIFLTNQITFTYSYYILHSRLHMRAAIAPWLE